MTRSALAFTRMCAALVAIALVVSGCASSGSRPSYIGRGSVGLRNIRAVLVSVNGVTQVAYYRDGLPTDRAHVFSVTKSVLSTLVGIALEEGVLEDLSQDLRTLLPEYGRGMSEAVASITVEQLLTMTSGLPEGTIEEDPRLDSPDWVREALRGGTVAPPGTTWNYSDPASDVLAAVLTAALERHDGENPRSLLDFARERLFDPLEIQSRPAYVGFEGNEPWSAKFNDQRFGWATDHRGRHYGCCMLKLTAADMVKIGELYLQDGRWKERQIISANWVAAATTPIPLDSSYGRMWWIGDIGVHHAFFADGRGGQLIAVVPDLELVVAISSLLDVENETNKYLIGKDLLPMVNDVIVTRLQ